MYIRNQIKYIIAVILGCIVLSGCNSPKKKETTTGLGDTIGSLVEVVLPESISLEGYGLVGNLRRTGSSQCPPAIRNYLTQYIMSQKSGQTTTNVDSLINGLDTAVVQVEAVMPIASATSNYFDVKVTALSGTQTSSLDFGWLYRTELQMKGTFGLKTEIFADAEGPVFVDKINPSGIDKRSGYILAGGKNLVSYKIILVLKKTDVINAYLIRNRLNTRFGRNVAKALSDNRIEVTIPEKYEYYRQKFISLIRAIYLTETPGINAKRSQFYSKQFVESQNKQDCETALEAIGIESLAELSVLLNSNDQEVSFRAARCMLNLNNDAGLQALKQIAWDDKSQYRVEAIEAIAFGASKSETIAISQRLLRDNNFDVKLAAYEQLRKLDDVSISRKLISESFYLEQIVQPGPKIIYVSRSGQPKIVLFGAPIYCKSGDIFIESADGELTINAQADQNYLLIIRKNPKRVDSVPRLTSTLILSDVIQTLCMEPLAKDQQGTGGLGVPYADTIALLKQMCDKGVIEAKFIAGPLPKIDLNVKK